MAEETYHRLTKKKLAHLTATDATCRIESEIVLPDYKAEAERIVRAIPKAVIKNKNVYLRDRLLICEVEGSAGFHILYRTAEKETEDVSSFLHSEPFSHTFQIPLASEEITAEDVLILVEGIPRTSFVKLQGPRKMSAKCEITLALNVKYNQELAMLLPEESEDMITKSEEVKLTRIHSQHTEEMSFSQTITLPGAYLPVHEICEMEAVLFSRNVRAEDGGVSFLGLCDLHCSYTAEGENIFISFFQPIEFERRIGIPELTHDHTCRVDLTPVALKASPEINEDGENKNILFELDFLCEVCVFETESLRMTRDVFSTKNRVLVERKTEQVQELLGSFDFSDTLKAQLASQNSALTRAEGICAGVEFRNSYLEEGKICLEGRIAFSYLGITENGEMKNYEDTYEFKSAVIPSFSIPEGEECSIEVCGGVRGVDVEPEEEKLRLRLDLCGSICVYVTHRPELVCNLELGEEYGHKRGEILFVYPHKGEDLWSLAKEYHVSPERVKAQNHLVGEELPTYLKFIR